MADTLRWCGKTLQVSAQQVCSFEDLAISAGVKTKTQSQDGVERVQEDGLNAASITLTVRLSRALGVDVSAEVSDWMGMLRAKRTGNIVLGGRDLFGVPFMLTDVEVSNVRMAPDGSLSYAEAALTFKECIVPGASYGGSGGGGYDDGGGSRTVSTKSKKSSTTSSSASEGNFFERAIAEAKSRLESSGGTASNLGGVSGYSASVTKTISNVVALAKQATTITSKKSVVKTQK